MDRATVSKPYIPVVCVDTVWTELPSPSHTYPWSALILFGQSYRLQAVHTRGLRCCCLDRATVSKPYIPVVCVVAVWTELPSPSHTYPWSALILFGQSYRLQAIHTRGLRWCCLDRAKVSKPYIPVVCVDTVWTELRSPSHTYPWSALILFGQSYRLQAIHTRGLRCCCLDRATVSKPYIPVICIDMLFGQSYRLQAIHTRGLRWCCLDRATVLPYIPVICVDIGWTELPSPSHTYPWSALLLFGQSYRLQAIHIRGLRCCCLDRATISKPYIPVVCVVAVWTELPSPSHTYPWSALLLFGQSYRLQAIHIRGLRCCCLDRATISKPIHTRGLRCCCLDRATISKPYIRGPWSVCVVATVSKPYILFGQSYRQAQALIYIPVSPSRTYPWSALILFGQSYRRQAIHTRGLR